MKNSPKRLDLFRENGKRTAAILKQLVEEARTSRSMESVEALAQKLIRQAGGEPAFMRVPGYQWATCISVNDAIVHGIPMGELRDGDLVTVDTGMFFQGTTTDTATSFVIGDSSSDKDAFLKVGRKALQMAIEAARPGNTIRQMSGAMQAVVEKAGCSVSRNLTGHGLGSTMHEDPQIPCYASPDSSQDIRLAEGQVLAIEIMYMQGDWPLETDDDGWTMRTVDGSLSAVFEHDVIVTDDIPDIITA